MLLKEVKGNLSHTFTQHVFEVKLWSILGQIYEFVPIFCGEYYTN